MAFEFFKDGLIFFDEYTFSELDGNETISGTYNLDVKVKDKIYQEKFAIVINLDKTSVTKIPEVYLPQIKIPFKFEHIYKERRNLCCLGLNYEIEYAWGKNHTFIDFLRFVLDPFLVNYLEYKVNTKYIDGDRPHAQHGVIDYYSQFFPSISSKQLKNTLIYCLNRILKKEFVRGHNPCPCGSGKNIRKCFHKKELEEFVNSTNSSLRLREAFILDMKNIGGNNEQIKK